MRPWPGPDVEPDRVIMASMRQFAALSRAYGKTLHQAMETMEAIGIGLRTYVTETTEITPVQGTLLPPKGPPKHVGPRVTRQFDHRGRRRF